jgi:rubrerythrin
MKMICPKCNYTWESKTDKKPKACPLCKTYLIKKEDYKKKEEAGK